MPMHVYVQESSGCVWTGSPHGPCLRFERHEMAMELAQRAARRFAQTWQQEAIVHTMEPGCLPVEVARYCADGRSVLRRGSIDADPAWPNLQ